MTPILPTLATLLYTRAVSTLEEGNANGNVSAHSGRCLLLSLYPSLYSYSNLIGVNKCLQSLV
jgi:hypothetical protein